MIWSLILVCVTTFSHEIGDLNSSSIWSFLLWPIYLFISESSFAKKALLKCIEFLYNQAQSAETNNNAEDLLLIHDDIQYAVTKINSVDFGKLTPQWDKLAKKIENKGY